MENSQSKYLLVLGLILIIVAGFYLFNLKKPKPPYQVLTPESYQPGTTVSLYKDVPPGFPGEVVLEDKPLDSSTMVTGAGKDQIKVSYKSDLTGPEEVVLYGNTLQEKGWKVTPVSASYEMVAFTAEKSGKKVLITISARREPGTGRDLGVLVTFQYNNN